jgi:hypothetical protein
MIKGLRRIIRPNYQILICFFFSRLIILEVKSQANTLVVFALIIRLIKIRKTYSTCVVVGQFIWKTIPIYIYLYIIINTVNMYKVHHSLFFCRLIDTLLFSSTVIYL